VGPVPYVVCSSKVLKCFNVPCEMINVSDRYWVDSWPARCNRQTDRQTHSNSQKTICLDMIHYDDELTFQLDCKTSHKMNPCTSKAKIPSYDWFFNSMHNCFSVMFKCYDVSVTAHCVHMTHRKHWHQLSHTQIKIHKQVNIQWVKGWFFYTMNRFIETNQRMDSNDKR